MRNSGEEKKEGRVPVTSQQVPSHNVVACARGGNETLVNFRSTSSLSPEQITINNVKRHTSKKSSAIQKYLGNDGFLEATTNLLGSTNVSDKSSFTHGMLWLGFRGQPDNIFDRSVEPILPRRDGGLLKHELRIIR